MMDANPFGVLKPQMWLASTEPLRQPDRPANNELIQNAGQNSKAPAPPAHAREFLTPDVATLLPYSPAFAGMASLVFGNKPGSSFNYNETDSDFQAESSGWDEQLAAQNKHNLLSVLPAKWVASQQNKIDNPFLNSLNFMS